MELQHLQNFLVIVEQGSVSYAARLIRITQPALTRQLQALEAQFGAPLLARNRRGVVLTPAGRIRTPALEGMAALIDGFVRAHAATYHRDIPGGPGGDVPKPGAG